MRHDWLTDGGRIIDPLAPKPWGATDGQVKDRYGLHWLIGYEPAAGAADDGSATGA
ncbi:hypothetical protein AAE021_07345 [Arthrobacter citreus]|uniref:VOC family protein n=1 Tax=Arthrobacter citreus TaxID=1670 RepID=A0ABZ3A0H2_9MICC